MSTCGAQGPQGEPGPAGPAGPSGPAWSEPQTNDVNDTTDKMACGIADFTTTYLIDKFNDQLDAIEAAVGLGVTVGKIAADVVAAVLGFTQVAAGAIDAIKDVVEGSINLTFAVIRASDTVEWRSDVKCDLYQRLKANDGTFGNDRDPVISGWVNFVKGRSESISPLFGRFLDAIDVQGVRRLAKIAENNEGECDDCTDTWEHTFDFTTGAHGWTAYNGWATLQADGWHGVSLTQGEITYMNLYIQLNTAAFALDGVYIEYTDTDVYGSTADMFRAWNEPDRQGNLVANYSDGTGDHTNRNHFAAGTDGLDAVGVQSQLFSLSGYSGSTVAVHLIRIYGHGDKPAFE